MPEVVDPIYADTQLFTESAEFLCDRVLPPGEDLLLRIPGHRQATENLNCPLGQRDGPRTSALGFSDIHNLPAKVDILPR